MALRRSLTRAGGSNPYFLKYVEYFIVTVTPPRDNQTCSVHETAKQQTKEDIKMNSLGLTVGVALAVQLGVTLGTSLLGL